MNLALDVYLLAYGLLGLVAGVLAGMLGIGGGLVIVPALIVLLQYQGVDVASLVHTAIGSSLVTIIPTAVISTWAHHRKRAVDWQVFASMSPGLLLGASLGALLADQLQSLWLQRVFGLFLMLVAAQMLLGKLNRSRSEQLPVPWLLRLAGLMIGTVSGLLGIGGGTMTVPMLARYGKPLAQAVATSAACGLPIALAGSLGFIWLGEQQADYSTGYVYWPAVVGISVASMLAAPWGASLAHSLPVPLLKRVFALMLVLVGLKLLSG